MPLANTIERTCFKALYFTAATCHYCHCPSELFKRFNRQLKSAPRRRKWHAVAAFRMHAVGYANAGRGVGHIFGTFACSPCGRDTLIETSLIHTGMIKETTAGSGRSVGRRYQETHHQQPAGWLCLPLITDALICGRPVCPATRPLPLPSLLAVSLDPPPPPPPPSGCDATSRAGRANERRGRLSIERLARAPERQLLTARQSFVRPFVRRLPLAVSSTGHSRRRLPAPSPRRM